MKISIAGSGREFEVEFTEEKIGINYGLITTTVHYKGQKQSLGFQLTKAEHQLIFTQIDLYNKFYYPHKELFHEWMNKIDSQEQKVVDLFAQDSPYVVRGLNSEDVLSWADLKDWLDAGVICTIEYK